MSVHRMIRIFGEICEKFCVISLDLPLSIWGKYGKVILEILLNRGEEYMNYETSEERFERFVKLLMKSRQKSGVSQERLADELNVSRRTIQNWETGKSCPTIFQLMEWFRVLKENPVPYYMELLFPREFANLSPEDSDERISKAAETLFSSLSDYEKRQFLYLLHAEHGSSPYAVLQMVTADLHCDLKSRVGAARIILENFEMCEKRNELVGKEHVMPDLNALEEAIERGKIAASKGDEGYVASYGRTLPEEEEAIEFIAGINGIKNHRKK